MFVTRDQHGYAHVRIGRIVGAALAGVAFLSFGMCSMERVESGNVGVRVNQLGSGAGVSPTPLNVGWYFTPPGVSIYEYPVFTNTKAWKGDERFTFQDRNGMTISADVSVAYRADPAKAPMLFQKYRSGIDTLLEGPVRQTLRQSVVAEASQLTVDQIYGNQKAAVIERARQRANRYLNPFGLVIEQLFWDSNINLPESVQNQIAARVENEQRAIATQAQVATATANANIEKAKAEGYATSILVRAKAEAEATRLKGEAAKASPEYVELEAIKKWNGSVPQIVGSQSQVPFIGPTISKR
jgi:regulator of protease activity HflC (stomatin/prohibitin superfamily)